MSDRTLQRNRRAFGPSVSSTGMLSSSKISQSWQKRMYVFIAGATLHEPTAFKVITRHVPRERRRSIAGAKEMERRKQTPRGASFQNTPHPPNLSAGLKKKQRGGKSTFITQCVRKVASGGLNAPLWMATTPPQRRFFNTTAVIGTPVQRVTPTVKQLSTATTWRLKTGTRQLWGAQERYGKQATP